MRRFFLDNDFRVYVKEDRRAATASLQFWAQTGSVHEGRSLGCGLSHFLEHMVFFGTSRNPRLDISKEVGERGGDVNAYTSHGHTVYYADVPSEAVDETLDMLMDTVVEPSFPKRKFAEEKKVILREKAMDADNPSRFLADKTGLEMFKVHPVRHPIIGYADKIEGVDREMMASYHAERYAPCRCFIVAVGDVDGERLAARVDARLGAWENGVLAEPVLPVEPPQACQRRAEYGFEDPLARISITYHTPSASDPDVPALDVLAGVLGQGRSSRLRREIRDERRLAVGVEAFHYSPEFSGIFGISLAGEPEKLELMEAEAFKQVERMVNGDVIKAEIKRVVNQQLTSYLRGLRSNASVAQIIGNSILAFDAPEYADVYLRRLATVETRDVIQAARRYLDINGSTVVSLSPVVASSKPTRSDRFESAPPRRPRRERRPSGVRLISYHDSSLPLVNLCLVLPGGSFFESDGLSGVTKLMSDAMFGGTRSYSESRLARALDDEGITLSISGGANTLSFHMEARTECFEAGLRILKSVLTEPLFLEETVERERENRVKRLRSQILSPHHAAEDALLKALYGVHPYGRSFAERMESVSRLTGEDLSSFHRSVCLNPGKAVAGLGGDLGTNGFIDLVRELLDAVPWLDGGRRRRVVAPAFPERRERRRVVVPREQTVVMTGVPGCAMKDGDRHALDLLQVALNGASSRLFKTIRDDLGLAYYVGLGGSSGVHPGFLSFYAGTRSDAAERVEGLLEDERLRLVEEGLSSEEFAMARNRVYHDLAARSLDVKELVFSSCLSEFYDNGYMEPWRCERLFKKISSREVNRVVRRYFDTSSIVTVLAGPDEATT